LRREDATLPLGFDALLSIEAINKLKKANIIFIVGLPALLVYD